MIAQGIKAEILFCKKRLQRKARRGRWPLHWQACAKKEKPALDGFSILSEHFDYRFGKHGFDFAPEGWFCFQKVDVVVMVPHF